MDSKFKEAIDTLNKKREESGIDINGKLYSMVKDRIEVFRKMWGSDFGIHTDIDYHGFNVGDVVVAKAHVTNSNGNIVASGHAMDRVGQDEISKTAVIEAVETAAIGRALACFGLHGGEYASEAEMSAIPRKQQASGFDNSHRQVQPDVSRETKAPVIMTSGLYVPADADAVWNQPHGHIDRVIEEIGSINDNSQLAKYWSELAQFRKLMESQTPDRLSELKAAFSTQNARMKS